MVVLYIFIFADYKKMIDDDYSIEANFQEMCDFYNWKTGYTVEKMPKNDRIFLQRFLRSTVRAKVKCQVGSCDQFQERVLNLIDRRAMLKLRETIDIS